jgi:hypothetical protein
MGWLSLSTLERSIGLDAFREGLRDLGWAEGKTLAIEFRFAAGEEERLPELAAELVSLPVDVILATSTPSAQAATQATEAVPVIFAVIADPVGSGRVAALDGPGGNATGLSYLSRQLSAKRLELLRGLVPGWAAPQSSRTRRIRPWRSTAARRSSPRRRPASISSWWTCEAPTSSRAH